jgi:hypothetical protein
MLNEYEVSADNPVIVAVPAKLPEGVSPAEAITPEGPETLQELKGGVVVDPL